MPVRQAPRPYKFESHEFIPLASLRSAGMVRESPYDLSTRPPPARPDGHRMGAWSTSPPPKHVSPEPSGFADARAGSNRRRLGRVPSPHRPGRDASGSCPHIHEQLAGSRGQILRSRHPQSTFARVMGCETGHLHVPSFPAQLFSCANVTAQKGPPTQPGRIFLPCRRQRLLWDGSLGDNLGTVPNPRGNQEYGE